MSMMTSEDGYQWQEGAADYDPNYELDEPDPDGPPVKVLGKTLEQDTALNHRYYALEKALWLKGISHQRESHPMTGTEAMQLAEQIVLFMERGIATRPQEPQIMLNQQLVLPIKLS